MPEETVELLQAIHEVQTRYIQEADSSEAFENLLGHLLTLTRSEYGFIGEIRLTDAGERYLKTHAITNIAWDEATRKFYDENAPEGLEFFNQETLFGEVLKTGEPVLSNDPANDPRAGGTPPGHPPLKAFLGLPICFRSQFIGMVGIANRPGGYDEALIRFLEPFSSTCSTLLHAYYNADRHRLAEEESEAIRRQMLEAQKMESLGSLAGGLAHEFNNLLVGVIGNATLLRDTPLRGISSHELLDEIVEAGERAAGLCTQMLAYAGKGRFQISEIRLTDLVEEMTGLISSSIPRSIEVRYRLVSALPAVQADVHQMRQLVMNLLLNAAEASDDQKGVVTVSTGLARFDSEDFAGHVFGEDLKGHDLVYLEVRDTGCGIEDAVENRIFDPFFSTKFTGRGLGLAAVQGIVRSHGGAIAVESEPGRGSSFRVFLPALEGRPAVVPPPPRAEPAAEEFVWNLPGKVLVIDDEEGVRAYLSRVLEDAGAPFLTAADGIEGLRQFRRHRDEIVVVVLDLEMPRMNGVEALEELRALDPDVRVVMSSGFSEEDVVDRFAGRPPDHFIHKPYTAEALLELLRKVSTESQGEAVSGRSRPA